jgi:hypothetical protein
VTKSIEIGDRAGIVVAVVCAVHCLAAPLFAASLPLAGMFTSERTELAFVISSFLISGATVAASCLRRGARRAVWVAFLAGAIVILSARLVAGLTLPVEQGLVMAGATLTVAAHSINLLRCRCTLSDKRCASIV